VKITETLRQKVIELDRRYRSSWDARSIAHTLGGISHASVNRILQDERGPRPKRAKRSHDRRTRFLRRDVMWSTDFVELWKGVWLIKTMDEMSRYRLGWTLVRVQSSAELLRHAQDIVRRMGRAPLVWKYDHGSPFTSRRFQEFLAEHKILPFPIPPRAPWANGRVERDHQEIQNWLIPLQGLELSGEQMENEVQEGMFQLNFIKPRWVLGYKTSAAVYFNTDGIEEMDREHLRLNLEDILCQLGWTGWRKNERLHRKAVRKLLQNWGLYEEWEEIPKGAETVNRSGNENVSI
jgi:transposase InsO family protein